MNWLKYSMVYDMLRIFPAACRHVFTLASPIGTLSIFFVRFHVSYPVELYYDSAIMLCRIQINCRPVDSDQRKVI